jgi:hypothetical protein
LGVIATGVQPTGATRSLFQPAPPRAAGIAGGASQKSPIMNEAHAYDEKSSFAVSASSSHIQPQTPLSITIGGASG